MHYTGFAGDSFSTLEENDKISFEIVDGEKGPRASKVELVAK